MLMRGKATSFAPIMMGKKKFPSAAGTLGMMKRKTMTAPWSVKKRLYVSASMMVLPREKSSRRTSSAKMPPARKARLTIVRYISPMRLWSSV